MHQPLKLKQFARELRRCQTLAERAMWANLRNRGFMNLKFRRQVEIGNFIVDFYCEDLRLAIELDGQPHFDPAQISRDAARTEWLQRQGLTVLRVENEEFLVNGDLVLNRVRRTVERLRHTPLQRS